MRGDNDPLYHSNGHGHHRFELPAGLLRVAGVFALSLLLSSQLPHVLVPVAMSEMLGFAALASASVALLGRQPVTALRMTPWDEAAALLAMSLLAGMLVDPNAAKEAVEALKAATGG
jgi:phosphoribosylcarboxyaminoimidazole (NCAIR) mutase